MLINDNASDNFFHDREIKKINPGYIVLTMNTAIEALSYLKAKNTERIHPDLIFLDINMPVMNGWEFLQEYEHMEKKLQPRTIIIMLTTSENIYDKEKAKNLVIVSDYMTKPLTKEILNWIIIKYFNNNNKANH